MVIADTGDAIVEGQLLAETDSSTFVVVPAAYSLIEGALEHKR